MKDKKRGGGREEGTREGMMEQENEGNLTETIAYAKMIYAIQV